jgi:hypothetical protein
MGYTISIAYSVFPAFVFFGFEVKRCNLCIYMEDFKYWEEVVEYVLAAVRLGSRRGRFCCRAKIYTTLFTLTREFKELAHLCERLGIQIVDVYASLKSLVRLGFLEERLEMSGVIDGVALPGYGVYTYRLTRAGRALADVAAREVSLKIKKRMKELLKLSVWSLIGYAYVRYPEEAWPVELA